MRRKLRAVAIGSLAGAVGCALGLFSGFLLALVGKNLDIGFRPLVIFALLGIGSLLFFFVLPIENKYFWLKIVERPAYKSSGDSWKNLYEFAPATFFYLVGTVIGLHYAFKIWVN